MDYAGKPVKTQFLALLPQEKWRGVWAEKIDVSVQGWNYPKNPHISIKIGYI
jgi:hypothetical protein